MTGLEHLLTVSSAELDARGDKGGVDFLPVKRAHGHELSNDCGVVAVIR
jgi:hypothetical protein